MLLPKIDDWTVDEIKDALTKAPDVASVNAVAVKFQKEVLAMQRDPKFKTQAIQIKNLAAYRRKGLLEGWLK